MWDLVAGTAHPSTTCRTCSARTWSAGGRTSSASSPGTSRRVSWHQDASYWPLTPSRTVTVWLAIDDADEENGAMAVVPRSHLHGQIAFHPQRGRRAERAQPDGRRPPAATGRPPVAFVMRAGQISLHTDLLLHGSNPNLSDRRRCGLDHALRAARGASPQGLEPGRRHLPRKRPIRPLAPPPAARGRARPEPGGMWLDEVRGATAAACKPLHRTVAPRGYIPGQMSAGDHGAANT